MALTCGLPVLTCTGGVLLSCAPIVSDMRRLVTLVLQCWYARVIVAVLRGHTQADKYEYWKLYIGDMLGYRRYVDKFLFSLLQLSRHGILAKSGYVVCGSVIKLLTFLSVHTFDLKLSKAETHRRLLGRCISTHHRPLGPCISQQYIIACTSTMTMYSSAILISLLASWSRTGDQSF